MKRTIEGRNEWTQEGNDMLLVKWLMSAGLPYNTANNKDFQNFVHYNKRENNLPGHTKVTDMLMPALCDKVQAYVNKELQ